jgi:hypothetical protein
MLIEIDASACADALAGSVTSRACIDNFLRAHQAGKHVVWLDREQARTLEAVPDALSPPARGALRDIRAQSQTIRGLRDRMRWSIRVGRGLSYQGTSVLVEGREVLHVDLHHFVDEERSGRSILLGEHLWDTRLYVSLGRGFAAARAWRVEVNFDRRLGGGGTTPAVLQHLVDDGRIVLAIVDSDQTHPGGPLGNTAQAVGATGRTPLQHLHVIPVRSAENLITSAVYEETFKDPPADLAPGRQRARLADLENLKRAEASPSRRPWRDHAELKGGLRWFEVQQMAPGSDEAVFWSGVAVDLGRDRCVQTQPCADRGECRCYVTDPLGTEALRLAEAWLAPRDPARNARLLCIHDLPHGSPLRDLCEKIVAWGLALRR